MSGNNPPPVIIVTAFNDARMAVQLLQAGAKDYLVKPFPREELLNAVHQQLELGSLRQENRFLKKELSHAIKEDNLIQNDEATKKYIGMADQAARSEIPLLIYGDSGSGKHTLARHVHFTSDRRAGALVEVSLNTLQPELMESLLFGHVKGAFTGAERDHLGFFQEAHAGTLVLSGYEEMPVELQAKFLRVMETKKIRALGSTEDSTSDFRLISLFHDDPKSLVDGGRLREDLYFRLNVISIEVLPLSKRRDDIWPLACHFASLFGREIKANSRSFLESHSWPGNARELKNRIEQCHVFQENGALNLAEGWTLTEKSLSLRTLNDLLLEHVQFVLNACNGNKSQAAKILGISRRTLYSYLKEDK
jgi:DNA-binding NtrC family response regulator